MQLKPKLLRCLIQWDMENLLKTMVRNSLHLLRVLTIKRKSKKISMNMKNGKTAFVKVGSPSGNMQSVHVQLLLSHVQ